MDAKFLLNTIFLLLVLQIVVSSGCRRNKRRKCCRDRDCCLSDCCCEDDYCCEPPRCGCGCRYKPRRSHRCRSRCYADECCCCGSNRCGSSCCSPQKMGDTIIITGNNRPPCTCGCCQLPMNTCSGGKVIVESPPVCGCQPVPTPWSYGAMGCDPCNNSPGKTTVVIKEPVHPIPCC